MFRVAAKANCIAGGDVALLVWHNSPGIGAPASPVGFKFAGVGFDSGQYDPISLFSKPLKNCDDGFESRSGTNIHTFVLLCDGKGRAAIIRIASPFVLNLFIIAAGPADFEKLSALLRKS
jgi:hypothetical protein